MSYRIAILVGLCCGSALAGTVVTRDGRTLDGTVQFDAGAVVVSGGGAGAKPVSVPMAEVASATLTTPAAKPAAPSTRPADWATADIGPSATPGRVEAAADRVSLADSGKGMGARRRGNDSLFFAYQKLAGDVTIVARLRVMEANYSARAGVMIRSALDPDAASVMVARSSDGGSAVLRRSAAGLECDETCRGERRIIGATWLKLERRGYTFTASDSTDGKTWVVLGTLEVPMDEAVLVGLAASSCSTGGGRSVFDNLGVTVDASGKSASTPRSPRGLTMRGGSILAGEVIAADDVTVELAMPDGSRRTLAAATVARCAFTPLLAAHEDKLKSAEPGVLLVSGDYLEGDVKWVERGAVKVSSVLFGAKTIDTREAVAVVLRAVKPGECQFEIRLANRSVLRAKSVEASKDKLVIDEADLGKLTVVPADVVEIRRPG